MNNSELIYARYTYCLECSQNGYYKERKRGELLYTLFVK